MKEFDRSAYRYTAFFCEENIWHLARALIAEGLDAEGMQVVILSNRKRRILLNHQEMGAPGQVVIWDYHMILLVTLEGEDQVFDFETTLGFPCTASRYFRETLPRNIPRTFSAKLRLVPALSYLERFYSDRRHMIGEVGVDAFPPWPPIIQADKESRITLQAYLDMDRTLGAGSMVICRG